MYQKYIVQIPKLIPSEVCKKIISYFDKDLEDARVSGGLPDGVTNKKLRNCTKSHIYPDLKKSFGQTLSLNYLQSKIVEATNVYHKQFSYNPNSKFEHLTQIDFLKYENNGIETGYKWHADVGRFCAERACTISISLNNNYQGGAFKLMVDNQEVTYVQNEGDCLMFPSNFMFPHQVEPISKGTRYALVAWVI